MSERDIGREVREILGTTPSNLRKLRYDLRALVQRHYPFENTIDFRNPELRTKRKPAGQSHLLARGDLNMRLDYGEI